MPHRAGPLPLSVLLALGLAPPLAHADGTLPFADTDVDTGGDTAVHPCLSALQEEDGCGDTAHNQPPRSSALLVPGALALAALARRRRRPVSAPDPEDR